MRVNSRTPLELKGPATPTPFVDDVVDRVTAPEIEQINTSKERRTADVGRKQSLQTLGKLLDDLSGTADKMKRPIDFRRLTGDSSHPDILGVSAGDSAQEGNYQVEILNLATPYRLLSQGFPDKDKTSVGFGFLTVNCGGTTHDVPIPPGSNLADVASRINEATTGLRASVIKTGEKDDGYRLMVTGMKSGENAEIFIDGDSTFLELQRHSQGRDLSASFEGVAIKRDSNTLGDLVHGVALQAMKPAPGSPVDVSVRPEMDQTVAGVRDFVEKYNQIHLFGQKQMLSESREQMGGLSQGDRTLRQVSRSLQSAVQDHGLGGIGITTDPKTGELKMDETKLKFSLANNYNQVVEVFTSNRSGVGLAQEMGDVIRSLRDRTSGAIGLRLQGLDQCIRRQDDEITRKEEQMQNRRTKLAGQFSSLNAKMEAMNAESGELTRRLGGYT